MKRAVSLRHGTGKSASTPGQPRTITYKSKDKEVRFEFTGSIIAISNIPLRQDPLARALGSRIVMLEHEPTDEEIAAFNCVIPLR